ncbi:hypothetical protein [Rhizobium alvei]|uniref:Transposase n=1 Tax=Rhizobium alvei TaxID=1132659 RepID=A0ABT8YND7_9HYPH|nr:hypothetical protein [Rhizobium alvei]MDO6965235.1 hypothetical protein [Rhizobium alvei]
MDGRTQLQAFIDGLTKKSVLPPAKNERKQANNSAKTGFSAKRNTRRMNPPQAAALSGEYRLCKSIGRREWTNGM